MNGRRAAPLIRWVVLALVVLAWEAVTVRVDSVFFPPASDILAAARELWLSGPASQLFLTDAVARDVLPSLARLLGGFAVAALAGVALGTVIGLARRLGDYLHPPVELLRSVPPPALIPPLLVALGIGNGMKVTLIALGVVWPVLLNTIDGVRQVDRVLVDTGRAFQAGPLRRLALIVLPAASPRIVAGLRTSLSLALILMVISEMVAASGGIGFSLVQAQRSFRTVDMWAGIALLGVLGYLLNAVLLAAERRLLAWHHGARGWEAAR